MALLKFEQEFDRAIPGQAFPNGFEGEAWMDHWCHNCEHSEGSDGCVLIAVAMLGKVPYDWEIYSPGKLKLRYLCHDYMPRADSGTPAVAEPEPERGPEMSNPLVLNEQDRRLNVEARIMAVVTSFGGQRIVAGEQMETMIRRLSDLAEDLSRAGFLPAPVAGSVTGSDS